MDQANYEDDYDNRPPTKEEDREYMRRLFRIYLKSGDFNGFRSDFLIKYGDIFLEVLREQYPEKYQNYIERTNQSTSTSREETPDDKIYVAELEGLGDDEELDIEKIKEEIREENARKGEVERELKLLASVKDLIAIQMARAKINIAIFLKETREKVEASAKEMDAMIKAPKVQKEAVMKDYSEAMKKFGKLYVDYMEQIEAYTDAQEGEELKVIDQQDAVIAKKKKLQSTPEYKAFDKKKERLKAEIREAIDFEKPDEAMAKVDELRKLVKDDPAKEYDEQLEKLGMQREAIRNTIDECDSDMEGLVRARDEGLNTFILNRNKAIDLIEKPSFFKVVIGKIVIGFNKILGFNSDVIADAKEIIEDMKGKYYKSEEARLNEKLKNMDPIFFDAYFADMMDDMEQEQPTTEEYVKKVKEVMKEVDADQEELRREEKEEERRQKREAREALRKARKERWDEAWQYLKEESVRSIEARTAKAQEKLDAANERYAGNKAQEEDASRE